MQPQGHVQVLLNMIDFGMSPQQALDAPRFCIGPGHTGTAGDIQLESGIPLEVVEKLRAFGHLISRNSPVCGAARAIFGRGQIITHVIEPTSPTGQVLAAGSDPRADGCAMGW
jgi:gamma-glutamyltranspeptidase/glutathione hydrolase